MPMDAYASHIPILAGVASAVKGNILELGAGLYSTPLLHALSGEERKIVSLDDTSYWIQKFNSYHTPYHTFHCENNLRECTLLTCIYWRLAFVDCTDAIRGVCVNKLKRHADIIMIHDSQCMETYNYGIIINEFKDRIDFSFPELKVNPEDLIPWTSLLSDMVDLERFMTLAPNAKRVKHGI